MSMRNFDLEICERTSSKKQKLLDRGHLPTRFQIIKKKRIKKGSAKETDTWMCINFNATPLSSRCSKC